MVILLCDYATSRGWPTAIDDNHKTPVKLTTQMPKQPINDQIISGLCQREHFV